MEPLTHEVLDSLDFDAAAGSEAQAWRNLLPPEPWLDVVAKNPSLFGNYARHRLEAGVTNAPVVVVRARKAHQQVRPVPVVGLPERIAYRALCTKVLAGQEPLDRSSDAYQAFISGPIRAAFRGRPVVRLSGLDHYVVESDIVAFYEYIDHSRLLSELELRTSTVVLPRILVALLAEVQRRPFGLPQLLDPSDDLSEIYGRVVERELRRRGLELWRYNDDFRLVARGYDQAQAAVEALSQEASNVGLVLNERKTHILKFLTYFYANWVGPQSDGDVEFKPELIKVTGEYGDLDDDELTEVAREVVARLDPNTTSEAPLDAKALSPDDSVDVSRAIRILTKQTDPYALEHGPELFEYVAHIGHQIGTYLVALHEAGHDIGPVWDRLVARAHLFNAWQRIWIVYVGRMGKLLSTDSRRDWVDAQRRDSDPLLRAEATLALAPWKRVSFDDIDVASRVEPEALLPWYALAARVIPSVNQNRLSALKESHKLIELLLQRPPRRAVKKAAKRTPQEVRKSLEEPK
jgi:hypothetical protein